jgi:hypothetical protein
MVAVHGGRCWPAAASISGNGIDINTFNGSQADLAASWAVAPAIEQGVASSAPYVEAITGLITGTNATQTQLDALSATANAASAQFQQPLPADDATTTT